MFYTERNQGEPWPLTKLQEHPLKPSQKSTTLEYVIVLRPPDGSAEPENGHAGYAYEPYGCLTRIWSNSSPLTDQPNQKMTSLENGKLFRGHMRP